MWILDQKNCRLGRKATGLDKECEYRCESDMQLYKSRISEITSTMPFKSDQHNYILMSHKPRCHIYFKFQNVLIPKFVSSSTYFGRWWSLKQFPIWRVIFILFFVILSFFHYLILILLNIGYKNLFSRLRIILLKKSRGAGVKFRKLHNPPNIYL